MAARAMWKAELCLGDERVPVKLYAAAQDRKVHFRLLHEADHEPVRQQMLDPVRQRPVPNEKIRRGVEVDKGLLVVLTEEDQRQLEPKPSREIRVEPFIDRARLNWRWLDRPYYLGPDGEVEAYFALAKVLEQRDRIGIARWVLRNKRYQGALSTRGGYLCLQTLHYTEEMLELAELPRPEKRAANPREQKLAEQLIATLEGRFDPAAHRDTHRERVLELIRAKVEGRELPPPEPAPQPSAADLVDQLQASLGLRKAAGGR